MQYGGITAVPTPEVGEVIEITRKRKQREPYPGYTIFGNGKETRNGGKSMDILDVCKQLNTAEMNLMQFFRDEIEKLKANKEVLVNVVVPAKSDDWNEYLRIALKKNYPHMNCLGIIRREKRGTYMINPLLYIPPENMKDHLDKWNSLEEGCDE